jgi:hypothetical protein
LVVEGAHAIVRVAEPTRFASTGLFAHFFEPQIKRVVQEHLGQDG